MRHNKNQWLNKSLISLSFLFVVASGNNDSVNSTKLLVNARSMDCSDIDFQTTRYEIEVHRRISLFASVLQINYLIWIIDPLATDKSRYFAQPRPRERHFSSHSSLAGLHPREWYVHCWLVAFSLVDSVCLCWSELSYQAFYFRGLDSVSLGFLSSKN